MGETDRGGEPGANCAAGDRVYLGTHIHAGRKLCGIHKICGGCSSRKNLRSTSSWRSNAKSSGCGRQWADVFARRCRDGLRGERPNSERIAAGGGQIGWERNASAVEAEIRRQRWSLFDGL